jgi:hypothetical protein
LCGCFGRLCVADILLHMQDSLPARISDKPDDIELFANDKLRKYVWCHSGGRGENI